MKKILNKIKRFMSLACVLYHYPVKKRESVETRNISDLISNNEKDEIIKSAVRHIKEGKDPEYNKELFDLDLVYNSDGSILFGFLIAKDNSIVLGFRNLSVKSAI
jgi:hypothetical protein